MNKKRTLWRTYSVVAIFALIGFSMTGCPTDANGGSGNNNGGGTEANGNGGPTAPANVALTPTVASVAPGGAMLLTSAVGPTGASQSVTWNVVPATSGTISGGLLRVKEDAPIGSTLTVRATATDHPSVYGTATLTIAEHVNLDITITGIPQRYTERGWGMIYFRTPGTRNKASSTELNIKDASTTGSIWAIPGSYDVTLSFSFRVDGSWHRALYHIPSRGIDAGTNIIPFSDFIEAPTMTITVTGIPERYIGWEWGAIVLLIPEINYDVTWDVREVDGSSVTFTLPALPGLPRIYDILLEFENGGTAWYRAPSKAITAGNNTISFSDFVFLPYPPHWWDSDD